MAVTIVQNGSVITEVGLIERGAVVLVEDRIAFVGAMDELPEEYRIPTAQAELEVLDAKQGYICPGLIDVHIHGANGADTMDGSAEALAIIGAYCAAHGVTAFLPTTVSAPRAKLVEVGKVVKAYIEDESERQPTGARVIGIHLEGPYINVERKGAHPEEPIRPGRGAELEHVWKALQPCLRMVTLAPEADGNMQLIPWLRKRGITPALGHTAAAFAEAKRAFSLGAHHLVHAFNAMSGFHHREPGVLGAAMITEGITTELIADGVHVHPGAVELLYRLKGRQIILVSDSMEAAGLADGKYELGGLAVTVKDGTARIASGNLAGSTLNLAAAVRNMIKLAGADICDAVYMASRAPARLLGLSDRGGLTPGFQADVAVFDTDWQSRWTFVAGKRVYARPEA